VVAVPDGRAPLAEVRLRLPLGPAGWGRPAPVRLALGALTGVAAVAGSLGGAVDVSSDGQWADVGGFLPAAGLIRWLDRLAGLITTTRPVTAPGEPAPAHVERLVDDLVRRRWSIAGDAPAWVPDPRGAILTVVGSLEPATVFAAVQRAFGGWRAVGATGAVPVRAEPGGLIVLRADAAAMTHVTVSTQERPGGDEVARFLATAVIGGGPDARIPARGVRGGYHAHTGRDVCGPTQRAYVRAECTAAALPDVLADLSAEQQRLRQSPLTAQEIDPVREYCAAQLLSAFDSPATLADLLTHTVAGGRPPRWLEFLPGALRCVAADEVAAAARELYAPSEVCTVVHGTVHNVKSFDTHVRPHEGEVHARTR
jgi:zinc protease